MSDEIDWDGETPFLAGELFCQSQEDFADYVVRNCEPHEDPAATAAGYEFTLCEPALPPHFSMSDFLGDSRPPGVPESQYRVIDGQVNDWLRKLYAGRWLDSGQQLRPESVLEGIDWSQY